MKVLLRGVVYHSRAPGKGKPDSEARGPRSFRAVLFVSAAVFSARKATAGGGSVRLGAAFLGGPDNKPSSLFPAHSPVMLTYTRQLSG